MPWGDASRASYNADHNKAKAAARKEYNKNPDPKRQPLMINRVNVVVMSHENVFSHNT